MHYVGSLTLDEDLARAAGLIEGEKAQVVDITNGARLETYIIALGDELAEPVPGADDQTSGRLTAPSAPSR
ncbi:hypothetical protein Acsp01_85000 [Actinoplanes sp. NBRC 101535]|nr:hypothetical protein Acsp01_85000 [Actinoplanes sp. NBRC 101535]